MTIFLIVYMIIILLLFSYYIYRRISDMDHQTIQTGYLIALIESLCQKHGVSVSEVKMLACDEDSSKN